MYDHFLYNILGVLRVKKYWPAGRVGYLVAPTGRAGSGQAVCSLISGRARSGQASKIRVISGQNVSLKA